MAQKGSGFLLLYVFLRRMPMCFYFVADMLYP